MRTMWILLGGFALWGACLAAARLFAGWSSGAVATATWLFVALWFVLAALNMYVGIAHAGYSFGEELPIFLLIFLLPAIVAVVVKWRVLT